MGIPLNQNNRGKLKMEKLIEKAEELFVMIPEELEQRVEAINLIRQMLHEVSPFADEPVDYVSWIKIDQVEANDYNPNSVAPPEMELLKLSIEADGYTQPIVADMDETTFVVVDGFHRNRVGREYPDIAKRLQGYLPIVQIRSSQKGRGDRIASTIRHNRARGKHQIQAMSDIVLELKRRNWSDSKIGKQLGMDPDEVLRLAQMTGLAEAFANHEFSEAWEHTGPEELEAFDDDDVNLEWMPRAEKLERQAGWDDRTQKSSVLYGNDQEHLGVIQQSRFNDEWFWYAYTAPMQSGRAENSDQAKAAVEKAVQ